MTPVAGQPARQPTMSDPERVPTPSDATAEEAARVEAYLDGVLESTRKAADSWKTGVGGLLALATALLFLKGPDSIVKIDQGWARVIAAMAVLALLVTVAGEWQLMAAAYGDPKHIAAAEIERLGGMLGLRMKLAEDAYRALNLGRVLALIGLSFFVVATLLYWFAPSASSAKTYLKIVRSEGDPLCGEIADTTSGSISIKAGGVTSTVPFGSITAITLHTSASCE